MTANLILQKVNYPGLTSENFSGTACTGTDKTTGRELFVANGVGQIFMDRKMMRPIDDYTESGGTVTFNVNVDNRHELTVFR